MDSEKEVATIDSELRRQGENVRTPQRYPVIIIPKL